MKIFNRIILLNGLFIIFLLLTSSSVRAQNSYHMDSSIHVRVDDADVVFTDFEVDFLQVVNEDDQSEILYNQFDSVLDFTTNISGGELFILFNFLYDDSPGFNLQSRGLEIVSTTNIEDDSSFELKIIQGADRNDYPIIGDNYFIIGYYLNSIGFLSANQVLYFKVTFSPGIDTLSFGYTIIYDKDGEVAKTQNGTIVQDVPINYAVTTTNVQNGFIDFSPGLILPALIIPVILSRKNRV